MQGFVDPERTEDGLFDGFAAAGERDGGGFADFFRVSGEDS